MVDSPSRAGDGRKKGQAYRTSMRSAAEKRRKKLIKTRSLKQKKGMIKPKSTQRGGDVSF